LIEYSIVAIIIANLLVYLGLKRIFIPDLPLNDDITEDAAVIVSARNEESNIPVIAESMLLQDYDNFCLTIVDDHSSDNTFGIAEEFSKEAGNLKVIKNQMSQGKKNALTTGVKETKEEFILLTDADCIPRRSWISSYMNKFSAGYDLLFGIAPLFVNNNLVTRVSAFENLRSFILSAAAAGFKLPYSAAGRNIGFRRSSFNSIEGYKNTMEIPAGDDGLLIREAVRNKLKIGMVYDQNSFVYSYPRQTFSDYLKQRKRHTRTSFYYSARIKLLLSFWHLLNLLPLFLVLLLPLSIFFMIPLLIKLSVDLKLILSFQWKFGYNFRIHQILYLQLIYELILILNFFNALFGEIRWR
jgi:cellulose synthase/poly-beta-1,6-N-acetylglucosamine synthase-like glycosyltransferase